MLLRSSLFKTNKQRHGGNETFLGRVDCTAKRRSVGGMAALSSLPVTAAAVPCWHPEPRTLCPASAEVREARWDPGSWLASGLISDRFQPPGCAGSTPSPRHTLLHHANRCRAFPRRTGPARGASARGQCGGPARGASSWGLEALNGGLSRPMENGI